MENPLISLIIPFYNSEKYFSTCLDSVFNQDIAETKYEVICVNDASPDNSRLIVLEYQKKHSNLLLIEHEKNKKLGAARNTGRKAAKGKYLWNIDADDYIQPKVLSSLLEICESNQLDILMFNFNHLVKNVESLNSKYPFPESEVYSGISFLNKFCLSKFSEISPIWTQIYNIKFLNNNNIYSPEINSGEDGPYTFKALILAKRVMSITKSCYVYRANETSIGGLMNRKPSAVELFTSCFVFTHHINNLFFFIPANEKNIIKEFDSLCRYSALLFINYYPIMDFKQKYLFKLACRNNLSLTIKSLKWLGIKNALILFAILTLPLFSQKFIPSLMQNKKF